MHQQSKESFPRSSSWWEEHASLGSCISGQATPSPKPRYQMSTKTLWAYQPEQAHAHTLLKVLTTSGNHSKQTPKDPAAHAAQLQFSALSDQSQTPPDCIAPHTRSRVPLLLRGKTHSPPRGEACSPRGTHITRRHPHGCGC